jgi:DNA modification methylase
MNTVLFGDCREGLSTFEMLGVTAQTCVTSPPYYGLRDYGHEGQLGLEETPEQYVAAMVDVFRGVRRVLADDGTLWLNIGDSYCSTSSYNAPRTSNGQYGRVESPRQPRAPIPHGCKPKDLIGIPWMLAFALRADGWYLRQDIIWHKPNPMPESVRDRCTKAHEYLFLLSKSERYFIDEAGLKEPAVDKRGPGNVRPVRTDGTEFMRTRGALHDIGVRAMRNRRSVWTVSTKPYKGAHFAVFPSDLIEPCILAGSRPGDMVLDPFMGSGTSAAAAKRLGRQYIGCELNRAYEPLQLERIAKATS